MTFLLCLCSVAALPPSPSPRRRMKEKPQQPSEEKALPPSPSKPQPPSEEKALPLSPSKPQQPSEEKALPPSPSKPQQPSESEEKVSSEASTWPKEKEEAMQRIVAEWEMEEELEIFAGHIKSETQYFQFRDYLRKECHFLKHNSDARLILSSGILPRERFNLLEEKTIIDCLNSFMSFKKSKYVAKLVYKCSIHLTQCDFIKYDSDPLEIVSAIKMRFPNLKYSDIQVIVQIYMDWLAFVAAGDEEARKNFPWKYVEDVERDYADHLKMLKKQREYEPGKNPEPLRDLVFSYLSKGLKMDLKEELLKFMGFAHVLEDMEEGKGRLQ